VIPTSGGRRTSRKPQKTKLNFPILGDADRKVATLYDMIHPEANDTLTSLRLHHRFDKKVRATFTYPASTGRHFDEVLRVIDRCSSQTATRIATPRQLDAGGDVVIIPSIQDPEVIKQKSPKATRRSAVTPHHPHTEQVVGAETPLISSSAISDHDDGHVGVVVVCVLAE